jgi:hypothetical protein
MERLEQTLIFLSGILFNQSEKNQSKPECELLLSDANWSFFFLIYFPLSRLNLTSNFIQHKSLAGLSEAYYPRSLPFNSNNRIKAHVLAFNGLIA